MDGVDRITHVREARESCGFKIDVLCVDGAPVLKPMLCKACRDAVNVVAIIDARKWPW
jgi:hypothetical protein